MSLSLGIFLLAVTYFAISGYFKGFFGALSRTVNLLLAYLAAFFFLKPTADLLQVHTSLDGMIVYFVAGLIIFVLVSLAVTAIFRGLDHLVNTNKHLGKPSKFGGLVVGIIIGTLVGFLLVYGISVMREARAPELIVQHTSLEMTARAFAGKVAANITAFGYPDAAPFAESFVRAPVAMGRSIQGMANNEELKALLADEHYQQLLARGDTLAVAGDPRFQRIIADADVRYFLQQSELGTVEEDLEQSVASALVEGWHGLHVARNDPRVLAIIENPDFQQKLHTGNYFVLMNDPQFKELTEAFFNALAGTRAAVPTERPQ